MGPVVLQEGAAAKDPPWFTSTMTIALPTGQGKLQGCCLRRVKTITGNKRSYEMLRYVSYTIDGGSRNTDAGPMKNLDTRVGAGNNSCARHWRRV